ncbi:MAG: hypothetical protein GXP25_03055 [Planctomycetes bacterium]|nr:hypothetical protein [Planctomycetota bacterium]
MPRKSILVIGAMAILISLAAYIYTTPKETNPIPVSREEFAQDVKGFDFQKLKGADRQQALRELQQKFSHVPAQVGPGEARKFLSDPEFMKTMMSLKMEERHAILGPSRERFRKVAMERLDHFFKLSKEEQNAELDRHIDMIERVNRMYRLMGGKEKDYMTAQVKQASPEFLKQVVTEQIRSTDSAHRAMLQEGVRRFCKRRAERRELSARRPPRTLRPKKEEEAKPTVEEIVVAKPVQEELGKLKVGDPVTIANIAEPGRAPHMIVARGGAQIGELPVSKWMDYAEHIVEKRQIWAKVVEVEPASSYLVIETTVR